MLFTENAANSSLKQANRAAEPAAARAYYLAGRSAMQSLALPARPKHGTNYACDAL
jgi:hypothetical protein